MLEKHPKEEEEKRRRRRKVPQPAGVVPASGRTPSLRGGGWQRDTPFTQRSLEGEVWRNGRNLSTALQTDRGAACYRVSSPSVPPPL